MNSKEELLLVNASFPNMISKPNLRVDELPPLITGQEIVDQDGHPPPVLAQPDLGIKTSYKYILSQKLLSPDNLSQPDRLPPCKALL